MTGLICYNDSEMMTTEEFSMKKMLALIMCVLLLCTVAACSADKGASSDNGADADKGAVSDSGTSFEEIDPQTLPSKVDLRDHDGKNYVTPVKTQRYGDCWTFSLTGAAEVAYLYANDKGVPTGKINDQVNYSEKYITCYMFHGITKDDVVKGRVRASQVGEGYDPSEAESERELTPYFIGGPFVHDANLFGAGFGPVDESVEVKGEYPYGYDDKSSVEWSLPLNAEYRCAPVAAVLRYSKRLPSPASADADGNYMLNADGLNAIKSELNQGHGVSIALCSAHPGFNAKKRAAYYNGDGKPDHAVTVVGYDDDYPKENFTKKNYNGEVDKDSIPPENGALIVKNSGGLTKFDGDIDDGYIYVSYYDHSLRDPLSFVFDSDDAIRHDEVNYDQYDLLMTSWYGSTDHDDETKMANVYDAEEDESLFQIAYVTGSGMTEVTYEIYKDVEGDDPASGTLLETGVNRHTFPGYYKIDLKDEYSLNKGDKYAVVLTMKRMTDEDGKTVYTEVLPYTTEFFEGMTVRGIINKGESYLFTDGKWNDMADMKDSLIDRAYDLCEEELRSDPALPEVQLKGKESMAIDNFPIKAILAPAE